jgi:hypothetical protein
MPNVYPAIIMLNNTPSEALQREALARYRIALRDLLGITP